MNDLHTKNVKNVNIYGAKGKKQAEKGRFPLNRAIIMNMKELRTKIPDVEIAGHPDNVFTIGARIKSEHNDFYRSFDVCQVHGGGVILQSSWYEQGKPAVSMIYRPDLALKWEHVEQEDGTVKRAPLVVKGMPDRFAFWKWLRNYVLKGVFGI